jgi:hypothetical protein
MMKLTKFSGVTAVLTTLLAAITACTTAIQPTRQPTVNPERLSLNLPDLGEAPEIRNEVWVNADAPVTLADSRGKVVLVEFWTFG